MRIVFSDVTGVRTVINDYHGPRTVIAVIAFLQQQRNINFQPDFQCEVWSGVETKTYYQTEIPSDINSVSIKQVKKTQATVAKQSMSAYQGLSQSTQIQTKTNTNSTFE